MSDFPRILALYDDARTAGRKTGSCDWTDDYPNSKILTEDIENRCIFIVEEGGKIIGAFTILKTDDLDSEPLHWTPVNSCVPVRICIAPDRQGKGLGTQLMHELASTAKESGYQSLRLLASVKNTPANRLYQRAGFKSKGNVHLYGSNYIAYEYLLP